MRNILAVWLVLSAISCKSGDSETSSLSLDGRSAGASRPSAGSSTKSPSSSDADDSDGSYLGANYSPPASRSSTGPTDVASEDDAGASSASNPRSRPSNGGNLGANFSPSSPNSATRPTDSQSSPPTRVPNTGILTNIGSCTMNVHARLDTRFTCGVTATDLALLAQDSCRGQSSSTDRTITAPGRSEVLNDPSLSRVVRRYLKRTGECEILLSVDGNGRNGNLGSVCVSEVFINDNNGNLTAFALNNLNSQVLSAVPANIACQDNSLRPCTNELLVRSGQGCFDCHGSRPIGREDTKEYFCRQKSIARASFPSDLPN
jgi:hypothetical protein